MKNKIFHPRFKTMILHSIHGFTLVEIMVVLGILGLLLSVALPRFVGRTEEARLQTARMQIETIGMALESFELDCGRFPTAIEGLQLLRENTVDIAGWKGPYLKKKVPLDPWKNEYVYDTPGQKSVDFDLYSKGPDLREGTDDDLGNW